MRKIATMLAVVTLAVAFGASTSKASSSTVNLATVSAGTISFASSGGNPDLTFVGVSGAATGTGTLAGASTFTLSGAPLVFTMGSGPNDYATVGTLSFSLNGGSLLTGTLSNITLNQFSKMVILEATLTVTGGSSGPGQGQIGIILDLPSGTSISKLTGVELARFSVGEGVDSVTPEPGTMLLFGSGALLLGGFVRRKAHIVS